MTAPRMRCPMCHRIVRLRKDGTYGRHPGLVRGGRYNDCLATGQSPIDGLFPRRNLHREADYRIRVHECELTVTAERLRQLATPSGALPSWIEMLCILT